MPVPGVDDDGRLHSRAAGSSDEVSPRHQLQTPTLLLSSPFPNVFAQIYLGYEHPSAERFTRADQLFRHLHSVSCFCAQQGVIHMVFPVHHTAWPLENFTTDTNLQVVGSLSPTASLHISLFVHVFGPFGFRIKVAFPQSNRRAAPSNDPLACSSLLLYTPSGNHPLRLVYHLKIPSFIPSSSSSSASMQRMTAPI